MHAKYLLVNIVFLTPLLIVTWRNWRHINTRFLLHTLGLMCLLTLVFDNIMIAAGIMAYNPEHILGIKLGLAPIEDFAYTLAAVLLVANVWERKHGDTHGT